MASQFENSGQSFPLLFYHHDFVQRKPRISINGYQFVFLGSIEVGWGQIIGDYLLT